MSPKNRTEKEQQTNKSFVLDYDKTREAMVIHILDTEGMYPCYWHDPESGKCRKIIKTRKGNVVMV